MSSAAWDGTDLQVAIIDYGLGNLGSAAKGLRRAGADVRLTDDPGTLRHADALVLPGDGAFGAARDELRARGLEPALRAALDAGTPLLGICVGMQLLFEESEEHGRHRGLALLPGVVRRFADDLTVPHMGWNRLHRRQAHPLLADVPDGVHMYFVHSYRCDADPSVVLAETDYGGRFASVVGRDHVFGVQFHPEKSQQAGRRLLGSFVRWCAERRGLEARA